MIRAEDIVGPEWAEWYMMSPQERWAESCRLWQVYLDLGGSLDPEPDTQSPFFDASEAREVSAHGRPGMHSLRRGGV